MCTCIFVCVCVGGGVGGGGVFRILCQILVFTIKISIVIYKSLIFVFMGTWYYG